jgi:hypothetical protein
MQNPDTDAFKKELKALLTKYDAEIDFECSDCSDTYGISCPKMVAHVGRKPVTLSDGWGVDKSDL